MDVGGGVGRVADLHWLGRDGFSGEAVFEQPLNDWQSLPGKDLACYRSASFACTSEVKWNRYQLCLHKEFGESVGWFGEKWMEPMLVQLLRRHPWTWRLESPTAVCTPVKPEEPPSPIMPAGGNKATESPRLETRGVTRKLPCAECIANTPYTFVSGPLPRVLLSKCEPVGGRCTLSCSPLLLGA